MSTTEPQQPLPHAAAGRRAAGQATGPAAAAVAAAAARPSPGTQAPNP